MNIQHSSHFKANQICLALCIIAAVLFEDIGESLTNHKLKTSCLNTTRIYILHFGILFCNVVQAYLDSSSWELRITEPHFHIIATVGSDKKLVAIHLRIEQSWLENHRCRTSVSDFWSKRKGLICTSGRSILGGQQFFFHLPGFLKQCQRFLL